MTPRNDCQASHAEALALVSSESMKILSDDATLVLTRALESMASF